MREERRAEFAAEPLEDLDGDEDLLAGLPRDGSVHERERRRVVDGRLRLRDDVAGDRRSREGLTPSALREFFAAPRSPPRRVFSSALVSSAARISLRSDETIEGDVFAIRNPKF